MVSKKRVVAGCAAVVFVSACSSHDAAPTGLRLDGHVSYETIDCQLAPDFGKRELPDGNDSSHGDGQYDPDQTADQKRAERHDVSPFVQLVLGS